MNHTEQIDLLMREKDSQRGEVLEINRTYFMTLFGFFTVLSAFGGVYVSDNVFTNDSLRTATLFGLSQLQWMLVIFSLSLLSLQNLHVGYIKALESKINELAGQQLLIWETGIASEYIGKPKGGVIVASVFLYIGYLGTFVGEAILCFKYYPSYYTIALFLTQFLVCIALLVFCWRDAYRAEQRAHSIYNKKSKEFQHVPPGGRGEAPRP